MKALQLCQHTPGPEEETSLQPMVSPRIKEPKVVVIREEFIAITGDPLIAAVLNQLVYWSQRVSNVDLFMEEEKASPPKEGSSLQYGWFYKTSSELIEETMLCVTPVTLRRYLNFLEECGWIETRTNPQNKWDRTTQYRVNLRKLSSDLQGEGYALPGFLKDAFSPNSQNGSFDGQKTKNLPSGVRPGGPKLSREVKNDLSKLHKCSYEEKEKSHSNGKEKSFEGLENDLSKGEKLTSQMENNLTSNTEITTENTNREHTQDAHVCENFSDFGNLIAENSKNPELENCSTENVSPDESVPEKMVRLWEYHVVQKLSPANWQGTLHLTSARKGQLEFLFAFHFQNDMRLWEQFCMRVKSAPFLMGEGPNGWHATLDWILRESNLLKILEGNYDDITRAEQEEFHEGETNLVRHAEKLAVLESIKDPIWKNWCSQLSVGVRLNDQKMLHPPLSLNELQEIANAAFLECEDNRLVWIGSCDSKVLKRIEDLRFKINWVFTKEYPNARTFRTRLAPINPLNQDPDRFESEYSVNNHKGELHA